MTAAELIEVFLQQNPGKCFCDDCLSSTLAIEPRQQVQQKTSRITRGAFFERRSGECEKCHRVKLVASYRVPTEVVEVSEGHAQPRSVSASAAEQSSRSHQSEPRDQTRPWYWEGNIVAALLPYLEGEGWKIVRVANTATKERGVDLEGTMDGRKLLVEVKGYPLKGYSDPRRVDEVKPTAQTLQAGHWYSQGVLSVMRLQTKHPDASVVLAFADFPRYRSLFEETRRGLDKMGISILFVREDGQVDLVPPRDGHAGSPPLAS